MTTTPLTESENSAPCPDLGNEQPKRLSPEIEDAVQGALLRLMTNYREFIDEAGFAVLLAHWMKAAEDHAAWLTPELIDQALDWTLYREPPTMQGGPLAYRSKTPPVGVFLDACRRFRWDAEDRAHSRRVLWLPAPKGNRPSNAELLRHIAIGKLRARQGNLLATGDPEAHEFSGQEIESVVDEMARRRDFESLRRLPEESPPLDALAALGVPPPAPVTGEWPR
jgi:hypothetical protein